MSRASSSSPAHLPASERRKGSTRPSQRRWWLIGTLLLVVVATVIALALEYGWWGELVRLMDEVNPVLTVILMALLPLAGFSIGVVYVVAGMKFGLIGGGLVIVGVTAVHLLGTHWIVRSFLRAPIMRFLEKRNYKMPEAPEGAEVSLAAMVALVPGPPYFLRNYALALSGIPLKKYFWVCLCVYTIRSYVTLALGDLSGDPSRSGLIWLAVILATKLAICGFLIRVIRKKHREMKTAHETRVKRG